MSGFAGIFNRDGQPVPQHELTPMLDARQERGPDGRHSLIKGNVALAHLHFWLSPQEIGKSQPLLIGDVAIVSDARLDNRGQLSRLLNVEAGLAEEMDDGELLLRSYLRWGTACLNYLRGDFAFVIWDSRERLLFLARDALGARGICYCSDRQQFLVASEISQILAHPAVEARINDNRVAARLAYLWDKAEETYYENIFYLPPAHGMIVTAVGVKTWRFWDVDAMRSIRYRDAAEYGAHYLSLLREAVRRRLRTDGPVGLSLSGGLDSSALAAIAAPLVQELVPHQERLVTFSYVFDKLHSCDERQYIEPTVKRFGLEAHYLPGDDQWTLKDLRQWPSSRDSVYADPYILLPAMVLKAAQERGIRLLLAGYFGDTLFEGGRYWALDMIRELRLAALARTLLDNRHDITWRQALVEDGLRQLLPRRAVDMYRRWRPRQALVPASGIHPDLLVRTDLLQRLAVDGRIEGFDQPGQAHRYRTLTLSVFSQGLAGSRHWYNRHGVEMAMPYYDRSLVEFVMAIPADELGRPNEPRRTQRRALRGLVPDEVLDRRGHTSFAALRTKGLQYKERETVKRILEDPLIVERKYIDPAWLERQKGKEIDLSPDGYMMWTAISLELWLQRYWS